MRLFCTRSSRILLSRYRILLSSNNIFSNNCIVSLSFYLHFQTLTHCCSQLIHKVYFKDLINSSGIVCNKHCRWLQFCFPGAKTFGQWYRGNLMKCILLYNIRGFEIQPQSAEFNTPIAITIIPMPTIQP